MATAWKNIVGEEMFIFHIHDYVKILNRWREVKERSEKELWPVLSGNLLKKVPITCHCTTIAQNQRLLDLIFQNSIRGGSHMANFYLLHE